MANLAVFDIITVKIVGKLAGQTIIYDFAYEVQSIVGPTIPEDSAVQNFVTAWPIEAGSPFIKIMSAACPQYTCDYVQAQKVFPARRPYFREAIGTPGIFAGTSAAPSDAGVITKRIDPPRRGGVGHLHITGLDVAGLETGRWNDDVLEALDQIGQSLDDLVALDQGGTVVTWSPVVLRRDDPILSPDIIGYSVAPEVRTMRRRVVGRGI